jgi:hypothetical protein
MKMLKIKISDPKVKLQKVSMNSKRYVTWSLLVPMKHHYLVDTCRLHTASVKLPMEKFPKNEIYLKNFKSINIYWVDICLLVTLLNIPQVVVFITMTLPNTFVFYL